MKAKEIREKFLKFFKERGHKIFPSASLIPEDPTLLFTSAGMVPFKNYFLGVTKGLKRAASSQLCMRTTDIDKVGLTKRHLTFFEMLGNFSFGDYFKEETTAWAWEFLTKELGLPQDKLFITTFKEDSEASRIWKKLVPENRIIPLGEDTNFWTMGPTGPCGPCSEIHWDWGKTIENHDCLPGCQECERWLEVWNLVFTQFDRQESGELKALAQKNIDTGMGLERVVAILQDKSSVFETDLFLHFPKEERVISDHLRASVFLISQGIIPSNEGRGYILRRLIRRALCQVEGSMDRQEPFLYRLTPKIAELEAFEDYFRIYQEKIGTLNQISQVIKSEEEKFLETLPQAKKLLDELIEETLKKNQSLLDGDKLFHLYETYGCPIDLAAEKAKVAGLQLDYKGFQKAQEEAKEVARQGWVGSGALDTAQYIKVKNAHKIDQTNFLGYDDLNLKTKVLAILDLKSVALGTAGANDEVQIVLHGTPFYPEGGGQVGDRGQIIWDNGRAYISNTFSPIHNLIIHRARIEQGTVAAGQAVEAKVDARLRAQTTQHHTATHLLHWALRETLGSHVRQAGSLVNEEKLRFDFTHHSRVDSKTLKTIENLVVSLIAAALSRERQEIPLAEAQKKGALMFFGEKYQEKVFTVRFGESIEACGGTHILNTKEIGAFKILRETSVGAGLRRIEAAAGPALAEYLKKEETQTASKQKKEPQEQSGNELNLIVKGQEGGQIKEGQTASGFAYKIQVLENKSLDFLRALNDRDRENLEAILITVSNYEARAGFVIGIPKVLLRQGLNAQNLAKALNKSFGGSAGGRPDFAQGGFKKRVSLEDLGQALSQ